MLSLDEPLDLKLPRRANGRDRGARSPPLSKRARQLRMADDGTAVIEPASPASPQTGNKTRVYSHDSSSVRLYLGQWFSNWGGKEALQGGMDDHIWSERN